MKAGILALAGLSAVAVAQPHARHQHQHKRNYVTEVDVVTDVEYATATAPNVVVYVDENGNPLSTSYGNQAAPTKAASDNKKPVYHAPAHHHTEHSASKPKPTTAPAYTPSKAHTSAAAPAKTSSASAPSYSSPSEGASGNGITYSPYTGTGQCKTQDDVNADFERISGYSVVRTYGTDCNQVAMVLKAMPSSMKLFAGLFDINSVDDECNTLISAVDGNWGKIDTVSVGNEGINSGTYTIPQVSSAVQQAKSKLSGAGYTGPVVTVDTFVAILANPGLCDVGDYVAANCHAFFDGGIVADAAGPFVLGRAQAVSAACGGKKTVITESGWPSSGSSNKLAVPGTSQQAAAVKSLKSSFSENLFVFTAFNDYWKKNNAYTYGAEWYWGIYGDSASCKQA